MIVSLFKTWGEEDRYTPSHQESSKVLRSFISQKKHKLTIENIRSNPDKKERHKLKNTLPVVTFCGKFSDTSKGGFVSHSGLMILDFDEGKDLPALRQRMQNWSCTYACFESPSGGGKFKALIRVEEYTTEERYKQVFKFFEQNYHQDKSGSNINRLCYVSYDPNLYLNENAKVFTREMLKKYSHPEVKKPTEVKVLAQLSKMMSSAPSGERQHTACVCGYIAGGYISSGQLDEDKAIFALDMAAEQRGGEVDQSKRAIRDGISAGKEKPLFDIEEISQRIKGMSRKKKIDAKNLVVKPSEMIKQSEDIFEGRVEMGRGIGIPNFDAFIRYRKNSFTFIVGKRGVGKTATVLYLLCLDSKKNNAKYLICGIENSPFSMRNQLVSFYMRDRSDNAYKTNKAKLKMAGDFVDEHFVFIPYDESWSISDLLDIAKDLNEEHNFDGFFIDPYNAVSVPDVGNTFQYHVDSANKIRMFSDKHFSVFLTAHPNSAAQRNSVMPTDVDGEGGGTFPNKAHMTMVVDRNSKGEGEDKYSTKVSVDKVRDKDIFGGDETMTEFPMVLVLDPKDATFRAHLPLHGESAYEVTTHDLMLEI